MPLSSNLLGLRFPRHLQIWFLDRLQEGDKPTLQVPTGLPRELHRLSMMRTVTGSCVGGRCYGVVALTGIPWRALRFAIGGHWVLLYNEPYTTRS